jgi:hypothetical protein
VTVRGDGDGRRCRVEARYLADPPGRDADHGEAMRPLVFSLVIVADNVQASPSGRDGQPDRPVRKVDGHPHVGRSDVDGDDRGRRAKVAAGHVQCPAAGRQGHRRRGPGEPYGRTALSRGDVDRDDGGPARGPRAADPGVRDVESPPVRCRCQGERAPAECHRRARLASRQVDGYDVAAAAEAVQQCVERPSARCHDYLVWQATHSYGPAVLTGSDIDGGHGGPAADRPGPLRVIHGGEPPHSDVQRPGRVDEYVQDSPALFNDPERTRHLLRVSNIRLHGNGVARAERQQGGDRLVEGRPAARQRGHLRALGGKCLHLVMPAPGRACRRRRPASRRPRSPR